MPATGRTRYRAFFGATTPRLPDNADRLTLLAHWITVPTNDLFTKSQVNFVWYHLMSRGLIEPIDDVRATNPPSHPELLEALAKEFVANGFNLRQLIRTILNSQTYQLSSQPNATNADDRPIMHGLRFAGSPRNNLSTLNRWYSACRRNFQAIPRGREPWK